MKSLLMGMEKEQLVDLLVELQLLVNTLYMNAEWCLEQFPKEEEEQ